MSIHCARLTCSLILIWSPITFSFYDMSRASFLRYLLPTAWFLVAFILLPPISEWGIELARANGFYDDPKGQLSDVVSSFSFTTTWWFQWLAASVIFTTLGMFIDEKWRRVELGEKLSLNTVGLRDIGNEIGEVAQDVQRFLAQRTAENTARLATASSEAPTLAAWQADRSFERETTAQMVARFGPRIFGSVAKLKALGIQLPPHFIHNLTNSRPDGAIRFISAMSELLKSANLEEAISLSEDRDFTWQILN